MGGPTNLKEVLNSKQIYRKLQNNQMIVNSTQEST